MDNFTDWLVSKAYKVTGGRVMAYEFTFAGASEVHKKGKIGLSQAELVITYNQLIYKEKVEL